MNCPATLILVAVLILAKTGRAIYCYQCLGCYDAHPSQLMECDTLGDSIVPNRCSIISEIGSGLVSRICTWGNSSSTLGCDTYFGFWICECEYDGCNDGDVPFNPTPSVPNQPTEDGDLLQCYVCTDCPSPTGLQTCASSTYCMKVTANGITVRDCGYDYGDSAGCQNYDGGEICYCKGDGCNGFSPTPSGPNQPTEDDGILQCYVCTDCSSPTGLQTCPGSTYCMKATANGITVRDCGNGGSAGCQSYGEGEICYCEEDRCNGAELIRSNILLLAVTILAICITV